jgi:carbonic anhydrase/acetyltransferase-like protein (isoleucine patch superfamily)
MLHDATVKDYAVVGVMATLSNRSVVGKWAIIGEASLVCEDQQVHDESIAVGAPVKVIGKIQERHKKRWLDGKWRYREFTRRNKIGLKQIRELNIKKGL